MRFTFQASAGGLEGNHDARVSSPAPRRAGLDVGGGRRSFSGSVSYLCQAAACGEGEGRQGVSLVDTRFSWHRCVEKQGREDQGHAESSALGAFDPGSRIYRLCNLRQAVQCRLTS